MGTLHAGDSCGTNQLRIRRTHHDFYRGSRNRIRNRLSPLKRHAWVQTPGSVLPSREIGTLQLNSDQ